MRITHSYVWSCRFRTVTITLVNLDGDDKVLHTLRAAKDETVSQAMARAKTWVDAQ